MPKWYPQHTHVSKMREKKLHIPEQSNLFSIKSSQGLFLSMKNPSDFPGYNSYGLGALNIKTHKFPLMNRMACVLRN